LSAASPYPQLPLTLEYEIQPTGTPFTDTANHTQSVTFYGIPTRYSIAGLSLATGTYHWQVRVCDPTEYSCSSWAQYGSNPESDTDFEVGSNTNPNAPANLGPSGFVDGSSQTNTQPSFNFDVTDSDVTNKVGYRIQVSTHSDFSSPVVDYTSDTTSDQGTLTFTVGQAAGSGSYTAGSASQVLYNGNYYWRVKSFDNQGGSSSYTTANSGAIAFVMTGNPSTDYPEIPSNLLQFKSNNLRPLSVGAQTTDTTEKLSFEVQNQVITGPNYVKSYAKGKLAHYN
jgi:hypothetical protein